MKIIYVAKHDSGGNDDEGAITHALQVLGHKVERLREHKGKMAVKLDGDMLLFHKWDDVVTLHAFKGKMPRVFWYFDLVDSKDPSLRGRDLARTSWMTRVIPHIDLGFCTDGDFVGHFNNYCSSPRLVHLMQGCDSRFAGVYGPSHDPITILFTGSKNGGQVRERWYSEMQQVYGHDFQHHSNCYGPNLGGLIGSSEMVVAPEGPVTDKYWSNRVYLTLGYRGFLFHPYSAGLAKHYEDGKEIVFYKNGSHLRALINSYYEDLPRRVEIAKAGFARTMAEHTYINRCADLIRTVKERLL